MKKIILTNILLILSLSLSAQCFDSLAFSGLHTIGKKTDNTWWGWGRNEGGQLLGSTGVEPNPIQVGIETDWNKVYLGASNTFVIKENGTLWGAGGNQYGSLGVNSSAPYLTTLQQITPANNWVKVAASATHTIALKSDGTIWAWGLNDDYQLGNSPPSLGQLFPIQVGTDTDWVDIDVSTGKSFALKADGTIWGWGRNTGSLIVFGTTPYTVATPTQIGTDNDWLFMSLGGGHILAQKTDSTLWSWGVGPALGVGGTPNVTNTPQQISTDKWKCFSAGRYSTSFGIKEDGTLWAWGVNTNGALGLGDELDRLVPTQIGTDNNWRTVQAGSGSSTSMGVKTDGTVWYWGGSNYSGTYGNGDSYNSTIISSPVQTVGICVDPICDDLDVSITSTAGTLTANATGLSYQWIDCASNTPVSGETGVSFTPAVDGSYAVVITEGFCSDTSACVLIETVGLSEYDVAQKDFIVSPNPAKDVATVKYELTSSNASLEVYDLLGKSLFKQNLSVAKGEVRLNTSTYTSGVYIVVIRQNDGSILQQKLVID